MRFAASAADIQARKGRLFAANRFLRHPREVRVIQFRDPPIMAPVGSRNRTVAMKRIRSVRPVRPIKPIDRLQNLTTLRPLGKNKWIRAHWRYDYARAQWEWIQGHWSK